MVEVVSTEIVALCGKPSRFIAQSYDTSAVVKSFSGLGIGLAEAGNYGASPPCSIIAQAFSGE
jgi:hypothetical protein